MELVYLWVEDYKNIQKQGFNFSPKFNCNYNPDSNELTINKNNDYIENFFGDNINMTAIVGKNGSGKSSIAEILSIFSYEEYIDEKSFFVYLIGSTIFCKQSYTKTKLNFKIVNNTSLKFDKLNQARKIHTLYFGNDISSIFNNPKHVGIKNYHGNINAYHSEITNSMPNNRYQNKGKDKNIEIEIFNKRFVSILYKYRKLLLRINDKIKFDMYKNELHFYEFGVKITKYNDLLELLDGQKLQMNTIFSYSENHDSHLYKLLILFRLLELDNSKRKEAVDKIKQAYKKSLLSKDDMMSIHQKINTYDGKENIFSEDNIENIISSFTYVEDEIWEEKEGHEIQGTNIFKNDLLRELYTFINRVNFFNSEKESLNFYSLSSGEQEYIKMFVTYIYHLDKLKNSTDGIDQEKIFVFDEPDLGLHPNWQKQLFDDLIYVADKILNKKIHILITTHSPFLLSDIPKQNIIFLDTYKEEDEEVKKGKQKVGNCRVSPHNEVFDKKQTFGANIHTLLSDSFFMDGGLMGEFAKNKIQEIIYFLNDEKSALTKDEILPLIEIIGEQFLRDKLKEQYFKKYPEEKRINREIEILKQKINKLEEEKKNDSNKKK